MGSGLKSASLISQLSYPPARPPPPVPPPPASYSPSSPPPPPSRTSASGFKPAPPLKSGQSEASFKRLQQKMNSEVSGSSVSNTNENAVKNLDKLMENIENIKNQQVKTEFKANDLESKLDSLTDQLKSAFESQSEINWENGKPEKFKSCHACEELIKSDTILAGPHHYHQHCFTCAHCNQALADNFYCVDNKNYCPQHKESSLNKCSECQTSMTEGGLLVEDKQYPLHCFR